MRSFRLAPLIALVLACNGGSAETGDATTDDPTTTGTGTTTTGDVPTTGDGPLCGNGMIDEGETCDGTDLDGKACTDLDPATPNGALACSEACTFDTSACVAADAAFAALNEVTSRGAETGPYAMLGDAVELYNPGDGPVDLSGWMLSDDDTFPVDKTYVFPPGTTIQPAAYLVLVAYDATTMLGELPFGISANNEETLTLADQDGAQVDQVIFPGIDAVVSYCRLPDGTGAWQRCDSSLGGANIPASMTCGNGVREGSEACEGDDLDDTTCFDLGFTGGALACNPQCAFEVGGCTSDTTVILNELESTMDQIELLNHGAMPVDISGWILTDEPIGPDYDPILDPEKLIWPAMSILAAGTYLNVPKGDLPGNHPFGLAADGDTITLLQADLTIVDQVSYGAELASVSYCRIPDGPGNPWLPDCVPTLGLPNDHP